MKTLSIFKFIFFVSLSVLLANCQKERLQESNNLTEEVLKESLKKTKERPFKGNFSSYFNFVPDIPGGWTPPNPAPAWYPGGGSGNLTHMGNCLTYFNQYVTLGPLGLQSVGAPVNQFFAAQLAAAGYTVPNTVSTIYYNSHGHSVLSRAIGISLTVPVSPTRVEFTANHEIIGGTGQFAGATGQYILSGFFNPQNPQQAGFEVDGQISY